MVSKRDTRICCVGREMSKPHYAIQYIRRGKTFTMWYNSHSHEKEEIIARAKFLWRKRDENKILGICVLEFKEDGVVWHGGSDEKEVVQGPAVESEVPKPRRRSRKSV